MAVPIVGVDAFTDVAFAGNPAAVCLLDVAPEERWMQAVAAEMNLAETAFLLPLPNGAWSLRWFTPMTEVDLCGHATLASAHVLWEGGHLPAGTDARFETRSGTLTCRRSGEWIEMDFPATPAEPADPPPELEPGLGVPLTRVGRTVFDWLVEVDSEATLRGVRPDARRLAAIPARGVVVTSYASTDGADFVSRYFAPAYGIDEDPVTGSTHCALGPYWAERLGKDELVGYQASRRGGTVRVRVRGARVGLLGKAVTVWRGTLLGAAPAAGPVGGTG